MIEIEVPMFKVYLFHKYLESTSVNCLKKKKSWILLKVGESKIIRKENA